MIISLPPEVIYEICYIIKKTHNSSPRGVADDINNFFNETYSTKTRPDDINACAEEFLKDVMKRALMYTEYCHRMTIVPGDVAKALDSYAETEANADKNLNIACDFLSEEEETEAQVCSTSNVGEVNSQNIEKLLSGITQLQARVRGAWIRDHEILCDKSESDFNDEEIFIDSSIYLEQSTTAEIFDAVYPPIENIHLSDAQFKQEVLLPFFEHEFRCHIDTEYVDDAGGNLVIVGMLKRATFAYLCKTLSN